MFYEIPLLLYNASNIPSNHPLSLYMSFDLSVLLCHLGKIVLVVAQPVLLCTSLSV